MVNFGAKLQGSFDEQKAAATLMGIKYIRPNSYDLSNPSTRGIEQWAAAGFKNILNINWKESSSKLTYCKDLVWYRKELTKLLSVPANASKITVAVIENEPTNDNYFGTAPIEDYIAQLRVAVEVCNLYGVKVTDGCTHVPYIIQIIEGRKKSNANIEQVKKLIEAFKTIPMTYCNLHVSCIKSSYKFGDIIQAVDYLRSETGHDVMSNEYHWEHADTVLVNSVVKEWKDSNVPYSITWGGGGGSPADALNTGSKLTGLGMAYRDAIK